MAGALAPPAVLGNDSALVVLFRTPALRTLLYVLLAELAFTDMCTELIIHPLHITYMLSSRYFAFLVF